MTDFEPAPEQPEPELPAADPLAQLRARYPKVREAIVVALHIITQNPGISLPDAKAQAALYGARITAASVNAAQRLLAPRAEGAADAGGADAPPAAPRTPRRTRAATRSPARVPVAGGDAEAMIRALVADLHEQNRAELERLRSAIRAAIDVLAEALRAE